MLVFGSSINSTGTLAWMRVASGCTAPQVAHSPEAATCSSMHDLPPMFFEVQPHTDAPASCSLWALAQPAPEPGHTPELARSQARAAARNWLCEQLAQRLGCAPEALALSDVRGQAPQLSRWPATLPPAVRDGLRLSVAHADGCSLLALHLPDPVEPSPVYPHGAVGQAIADGASSPTSQAPVAGLGVDLQAITALLPHECLATAQLFLHPADHAALRAQHAAGAPDADLWRQFAQAWAMHEARLKAAGLSLTEWSPTLYAALQAVDARPLHLPAAWANTHSAALAWRRAS